LAAILSLAAAEAKPLPREDFKLTDGRTFTGTYDEVTQTLALDGARASLKVAPEMIAERSPAKPFDVLGNEPAPADGVAVKSMTPEEKAAAQERFRAKLKADEANRPQREYEETKELAKKARKAADDFYMRVKAADRALAEASSMDSQRRAQKQRNALSYDWSDLDDKAKALESRAADMKRELDAAAKAATKAGK
jgi:hypothetical protein